jgi:hypothetical protein
MYFLPEFVLEKASGCDGWSRQRSPSVFFAFAAGHSLDHVLCAVALPRKDVGWFFEPTYSINPRTGERSEAFSNGLLFG